MAAARMMVQKLGFFHQPEQRHRNSIINQSKNHSSSRCGSSRVERLVKEFKPEIPIEEAITPPASWYSDPDFYSFELNRLFYRGWHPLGYTEQIKEPRDYFTGRLGNIEYIVCRDEKGALNAFHNVCRHHASLIAAGTGKKSCFVCPYHGLPAGVGFGVPCHASLSVVLCYNNIRGWTYGLDGALVKATRITGIKNFKVEDMGLVPLKVAIWGPFVLINFGALSNEALDARSVGNEWLGNAADILSQNGIDTSLKYLCRKTYTLECNWKVFCDNYLDGGYHVPYAHKGLASGLQLDSYSTTMYEKVSIQSCDGVTKDSEQEFGRLGSKAFYAFVYPNFMINRYGPWMDTNLVLPLGPRKCQVVFDYFLDASLHGDNDFINQSLQDSQRVQDEDTSLCNAVQQGLESPAYNTGRYSPTIEMAMHHFHCLLHQDLSSSFKCV